MLLLNGWSILTLDKTAAMLSCTSSIYHSAWHKVGTQCMCCESMSEMGSTGQGNTNKKRIFCYCDSRYQQMALWRHICFYAGGRGGGRWEILFYRNSRLDCWVIYFFLPSLSTIVPPAWINCFLKAWRLRQEKQVERGWSQKAEQVMKEKGRIF